MSLEVFGCVDLSEDADKELSLGALESFEDKLWLFSKESGEMPRSGGNVNVWLSLNEFDEMLMLFTRLEVSSCSQIVLI